jgi:DNA-binding XRE family transcriptional regulator
MTNATPTANNPSRYFSLLTRIYFYGTRFVMTVRSTHPLRAWRIKRKLTLAELGAMANCKAPFLSEIETGKKLPSMSLAARLSKITRISIGHFARSHAIEGEPDGTHARLTEQAEG